jgi:hypothetical protein
MGTMLGILLLYWSAAIIGGLIYVIVNWKWNEDKKGWLFIHFISDCIFIIFLFPFYVVPRYVILALIALAKALL